MRWFVVMLPTICVSCTVLALGDHLDAEQRGDPRAAAGTVVRVVTWNIETLGMQGSREYDAAQQVLARLDADVVLLQEVDWEVDANVVDDFARDAGYDHVHDGWPVSFGMDTQLILSRHPMTWRVLLDGDDLSPGARDVTRAYPVAGLDVHGVELVVASGHLKSGGENDDAFRRVVDARRAVQALQPFDLATDRVLFAGDLNDDLGDGPDAPAVWRYAPSGMPSSYQLGADLQQLMDTVGLANDAFEPFLEAGLQVLDARQLSGTDATRPVSWRRLDYVIVSPLLAEGARTEVYETADEGLSGGLPKTGPVPTWTTADASDHLPVVVDLVLATGPEEVEPLGVPLAELQAGELVITEVMANPDACSDEAGEWVEVLNLHDAAVDLSGLKLCDAAGCGPVDGVGVLEAGAVAVLARSASACGVEVAGTFSAALSNGGDEVALLGSVTLDAVAYASADPGMAWAFDGDEACEGEGTPGVALGCDGLPWGEVEPSEPEPSEPWSVDEVPAGVLRLAEVMPNPSACADDVGEWVEVHNTGDRSVDLSGLWLADNAGAEPVATTAVVAAGGRAVLARSEAACVPQVDGTFSAALSNGGDGVELRRADGEVLDGMTYGDGPSGVSLVVEGGWCEAAEATPGADNVGC